MLPAILIYTYVIMVMVFLYKLFHIKYILGKFQWLLFLAPTVLLKRFALKLNVVKSRAKRIKYV